MASIAYRTFPSPYQPDSNPFLSKHTFTNPRFSKQQSVPIVPINSRISSTICCSRTDNSANSDDDNYSIQHVVGDWIRRVGGFVNSYRNEVFKREGEMVEVDDAEWDWDRWTKYFAEIDDQQRVVSVLKV